MFEALHPTQHRLITHRQHREFAMHEGYAHANDAPKPLCPVCGQELGLRAGHLKGDGHFYHQAGDHCPTKKPSARPYLGLAPTNPDAAASARNRQFTRDWLSHIFAHLSRSDVVPFLDLGEFVAMLKEADRLNVYSYASLQPEYIPYVFVTLINFLPSKSRKGRDGKRLRELKFMFFYESDITLYEDLWIDAGFSSRLYRISYEGSQPRRVAEIETATHYLNEAPARLSKAQKAWCLKYL